MFVLEYFAIWCVTLWLRCIAYKCVKSWWVCRICSLWSITLFDVFYFWTCFVFLCFFTFYFGFSEVCLFLFASFVSVLFFTVSFPFFLPTYDAFSFLLEYYASYAFFCTCFVSLCVILGFRRSLFFCISFVGFLLVFFPSLTSLLLSIFISYFIYLYLFIFIYLSMYLSLT